jgi:hypothetical protein
MQARIAVLAVVCILAAGGAIGYFLHARSTEAVAQESAPDVPQTSDVSRILAGDHVVFRSSALGQTYGRLAVVPLSDPSGPRAVLAPTCERVYATATDGVCVSGDRGIVTDYRLVALNAALQPTGSSSLDGLPSRARISPDGSLIATTTFVVGHSYASSSFSTETIIRTAAGNSLGNLESWHTTVDGKALTAVDRNFWGVTFADDHTFYATAASGGNTWLVRGDIDRKTMTAIHRTAECPSVSPDHTRVAFKVRYGSPTAGTWHLAVLDLATGQQTMLAETRSVDDQVEWLDNSHVLYALPRPGAQATVSDVWVLPADGTGSPRVFIPQASSPAVVRT